MGLQAGLQPLVRLLRQEEGPWEMCAQLCQVFSLRKELSLHQGLNQSQFHISKARVRRIAGLGAVCSPRKRQLEQSSVPSVAAELPALPGLCAGHRA